MPTVNDFANVQISLSATPPSTFSFGIPCLLVDDVNVPIDKRQIQTTESAYKTTLTSGTPSYSWCSSLWGQNLSPASGFIGRWVSAASSPYFVCGDYEKTVATWVAVSDGDLTVTTTAGADVLAALDFSLATSTSDVVTVIQTALTAGGVSGATVAIDPLDRIVFTDPAVTGAGVDAVVLTQSGVGTDLTLAAWLDVPGGFAQGGVDAEGLDDAFAQVLLKTTIPFTFCERGGSIAQKVDLATAINASDKLGIIVVNDTDGKDSSATTDAGYLINALGYNQVRVVYHENSTVNPDAAECGDIFTFTEGGRSFAAWPLQAVSKSGLDTDGTTVIEMTVAESTALKAKGYDFYTKPSTLAHAVTGLASGGNEFRIMYAKLFTEAMIATDVYGYIVAQNVVTFSDTDILAIQGMIDYWLNEMVNRKALDAGYTITMPSAADFTAAQKASHIMDLDDVATADAQIAVNVVNITLTWNV